MTQSRSIAVWCAPVAVAQDISMEVHFNYWRVGNPGILQLSSKNKQHDFAEIGVMIKEPSKVDSVFVFLPFSIRRNDISDCSSYFSTPNIAQGIFNQPLSSSANARPTRRCVELRLGDSIFCRVHTFISENQEIKSDELEILESSGGTLITITRAALSEVRDHLNGEHPAYFRLRFVLRVKTPLFQRVDTPDRFFRSGFDEIEYVDFRLNEARTLPHLVESRMRTDQSGSTIKITLVAFLTAVPIISELAVSSTQFHKLRPLEDELWNAYVPGGIQKGMVVYHWKRAENVGIADFSAFVKLRTRRSGFKVVATYLSFAFLFGILGNLAASAVLYMFRQ